MRRALALALLFSVLLAACGRKREYPPPERYVPADSPLAVVVPGLGTAARQAGALYRTIVRAPQAVALSDAHTALKAQLGFDPLDPRGIEQAGVDPAGSAAGFTGPESPAVIVLPVLDLAKLDGTLARLARDRMGASQRLTAQLHGVDVVTFHREAKGRAFLAYASVGPHVLLASGAGGPEAVAVAASLPVERSLWKSAPATRAREVLGAGWLATLYAPAGSPALADLRVGRDGAALGVRAEASRIGLRLALPLSPEREAWWRSLQGSDPVDEKAPTLLPKDAALLVRWAGSPAEAARRLEPWFPAEVRQGLSRSGLDPLVALAPALGPGGSVSLSLAPTFTLADFSSPRLDARRVDPFSLVQVDGVLPVRDASLLRSFMTRLQKTGGRLQVKVAPRGPAAEPTGWTVTWGKAQLGLALSGNRLLVAGGAARLPSLESRAEGEGYPPPNPAARAALTTGLGGAVLDVANLTRSIEALPEEAYGTGPNAVVMRSLVNRYLEPAAALATVSLRLELAPGAALVDVDVDGREPPRQGP